MEDFNTTDTATFYEVPSVKNFQFHDLTIIDQRADNAVATADDGPFHCVFNYGLYLHNVKLGRWPTTLSGLRVALTQSSTMCIWKLLTAWQTMPITSMAFLLPALRQIPPGLVAGGNRYRHSVTCNTNSGGVYRRGRQRNIAITGITSFNANVAHFDMHQVALGVTFTGWYRTGRPAF